MNLIRQCRKKVLWDIFLKYSYFDGSFCWVIHWCSLQCLEWSNQCIFWKVKKNISQTVINTPCAHSAVVKGVIKNRSNEMKSMLCYLTWTWNFVQTDISIYLPLRKTVLFVSSRAFSLSTPVDKSEATWKKATKCYKDSYVIKKPLKAKCGS